MSVEAITWALRQPVPASSAKFVLVVLANCASADTGLAYPSVAYMADATGQDRKTVLNNLGKLAEWGLIEDSGKRAGSTRQIIVYRVNCGDDLLSEQSQKRNSPKNGTVPKNTGKSTVFPCEQSQKRDTEPSGKLKEPKSIVQRSASHFPKFWDAYPIKRNKLAAEKKWKAKRLDDKLDLILADVERRKLQDQQWLDGYVPHPATYLNGERWEDELGRPASLAGQTAVPAVKHKTTAEALAPTEDKLSRELAYLDRQRELEQITPQQYREQVAAARAKFGGEARA